MAKTRLAKWMREEILEQVKGGIQCPKEQKKSDRLLLKANAIIIAATEKAFPPKEMEILAKYEMTMRDHCGAVVSKSGKHVGFSLPYKQDESTNWCREPLGDCIFPIVPRGSCKIRNLIVTDAQAKVVEDWNAANDAFRVAIEAKLRDFSAVIYGARYVEELQELLPALSGKLDVYKKAKTALAVSDEVINRVAAEALVFVEAA